MKKLLIVNNNMKVGGVQKSLYNLLWTLDGQYDMTLCLFQKIGVYTENLPPSLKIVEVTGLYRLLGKFQEECNHYEAILRGILVLLVRLFGRKPVLSLLKCCHPELKQTFDCAISYLHNGRWNSLYGGVQDFVLHCVKSNRKVAFLHGDYRSCGADNKHNNLQIQQFDVIAACSDGCRNALLSRLPALEQKCKTVRNCHVYHEIHELADQNPVVYDKTVINVLVVARLTAEKGVDRAIRAAAYARQNGAAMVLHVVGDGSERRNLQSLVEELGLEKFVHFHGEQANPFRYMKNADLLLIPSYHEAAPMVIDEAVCLGLPVLTTETTSAYEMVSERSCGWVCENSQEGLDESVLKIITDDWIYKIRADIEAIKFDNFAAISQFNEVIGS